MRLLLDTHVFLWVQTHRERLGAWREPVEDPGNELLLSAASSWELAIKVGTGKLALPRPVGEYVRTRASASGVRLVPIEHAHVLAVATLPPLHRDPFDRVLIAQAQALDATLLTADELVAQYPGPIERISWPGTRGAGRSVS